MGLHLAMYVIPEFAGTTMSKKWDEGACEIFKLSENAEADRLNSLFKGHNPRCYQRFIDEFGEEPFVRSKMLEDRARRSDQ